MMIDGSVWLNFSGPLVKAGLRADFSASFAVRVVLGHECSFEICSRSSMLQKIFDFLIQIPGDIERVTILVRSYEARHPVV
jgi:hypothetical protein